MTKPLKAARRSLLRIFAVPIVMAVLSAVGLIAALLGDHVWDVLSWATLGIPVAVMAYYGLRR